MKEIKFKDDFADHGDKYIKSRHLENAMSFYEKITHKEVDIQKELTALKERKMSLNAAKDIVDDIILTL